MHYRHPTWKNRSILSYNVDEDGVVRNKSDGQVADVPEHERSSFDNFGFRGYTPEGKGKRKKSEPKIEDTPKDDEGSDLTYPDSKGTKTYKALKVFDEGETNLEVIADEIDAAGGADWVAGILVEWDRIEAPEEEE